MLEIAGGIVLAMIVTIIGFELMAAVLTAIFDGEKDVVPSDRPFPNYGRHRNPSLDS